MIFIDPPTHYNTKMRHKIWSHMATDGDIEALHQMANRLGLQRAWFQDSPIHPHYDVTPKKREAALQYKDEVKAVGAKELIYRCYPKMLVSLREKLREMYKDV